MAAVRRLSLVLDLNTGQFSTRIQTASGQLRSFNQQVVNTSRAVDRGKEKFDAFGNTVGKVNQAVWQMQLTLYTVTFLFGGFTAGLVKANAESQRAIYMLQGMSKAMSDLGKQTEAAQSFQYLMNLSANAPFSIGALTDAFVKMKSVGIDPTAGSMQALVDAVAAFGGTEDQLHRASIAIQQMMGKGVVSMEELRQQLGEAVPNAIQLTADAFGISYGKMVDAISKGNVAAEPFLKKMFQAMDQAFGGRAQTMMQTFDGQVSRLKTNMHKLFLVIGGLNQDGSFQNGGVMSTLLGGVKDLNEWLSKPETAQGARKLGENLAALINVMADVARWVAKNKELLLSLAMGFVALKVVGTAAGLFRLFSGALGGAGAAGGKMSRVLGLLGGNVAQVARGKRMLNGIIMGMIPTMANFTRGAGLARVALQILLNVVRVLSPWGLLATAILAVGAAFLKAARDADEFRKAKERAMTGKATGGDVNTLDTNHQRIRRERMEAERRLQRMEAPSRFPGYATQGSAEDIRRARADVTRLRTQEQQLDGARRAAVTTNAAIIRSGAITQTQTQLDEFFNTIQDKPKEVQDRMLAEYGENISRLEAAAATRAGIRPDGSTPDTAALVSAEGQRGVSQEFDRRRKEFESQRNFGAEITWQDTFVNSDDEGGGSGGGRNARTGAERLLDVVQRLEARRVGMEAFVDTLDEGERAAAEMRDRISNGEFGSVTDELAARAVEAARAAAKAQQDLRRVGEIFKDIKENDTTSLAAATEAMANLRDEASDSQADINKYARQLGNLRAEAIKLDPSLATDAARIKILDDAIASAVANERLRTLADRMRALREETEGWNDAANAGTYGGAWTEYLAQWRTFQDEQQQIDQLAPGADRDTNQATLNNAKSAYSRMTLDEMLRNMDEETRANREAVMDADSVRLAAFDREIERINAITDTSKLSAEDRLKYEADFIAAREEMTAAANERFMRDMETPAQKMLREWQDVTSRMKDMQGEWLGDFMDKMKKGEMDFGEFIGKMLEDYLWMIAQAKIASIIEESINPLLDMGMNFLSSMIPGGGGLPGVGTTPAQTKVAVLKGKKYHSGGIAGRGATHEYAASMFQNAIRYHTGGVAGLKPNEVPAVLEKGEGVFTREQMAAMGGAGNVNVEFNLINESGHQLEANEGGRAFDGEKFIIDVIVANAGKPGPLRNTLKNM